MRAGDALSFGTVSRVGMSSGGCAAFPVPIGAGERVPESPANVDGNSLALSIKYSHVPRTPRQFHRVCVHGANGPCPTWDLGYKHQIGAK